MSNNSPTPKQQTACQQALTGFVRRSLDHTEAGYFSQPFDPEWRSPCELRQDGDVTHWQPLGQTQPLDFSGLANAVEAPIHQDIQDYYSLYWSGTLAGKTEEGHVSLIQIWNEEDFTRLIENLVGHLFHKVRARSPFTVFFANTEEDSEYFLSIDNESGVVLLEEPGRPPLKEIAPDLATFLNRVAPDNRTLEIF